MGAKSRTRAVFKLVLLLSSFAVGLLVGEGVLRLVSTPPQKVIIQEDPELLDRLRQENANRLVTDVDAIPDALYIDTPSGKRLRANTRAVVKNHRLSKRDIVLETNSLGFRNPEVGDKNYPRFLFLGDSITLADYLDEKDTFVRQVESLSRSTPKPLETINAGVGAIGLQNELAILNETGLAVEPDAVVLCFYLNDVSPSPGIVLRRPPKFLQWSWLAHYLCALVSRSRIETDFADIPNEEVDRWVQQIEKEFPPGDGDPLRDPAAFNKLVIHFLRDWGNVWSSGAWERMQPLFEEFKRLSRVYGFHATIVVFPVRYQVEADFVYDHPQQRIKEIGAALDIRVLDLLPVLRQAHASDPERALFYDHCHHTEAGSGIVAKEIHAFLAGQVD